MFAAHFELPSPSCSLSCYGNFTPSPFQGQQQQQQRQKGSHDYNVKMSKQFQKKQKVEEQKEEEVGGGRETEKTTLVFHFFAEFPTACGFNGGAARALCVDQLQLLQKPQHTRSLSSFVSMPLSSPYPPSLCLPYGIFFELHLQKLMLQFRLCRAKRANEGLSKFSHFPM